jgi:putative nucleotidyltransferase with HDIG domain
MNLNEMIISLKNLPPAPRVMPKLLKLLNNPNSLSTDIVELVELDASLTARLIGISNSAYYGSDAGITDLGEAVNRLGFKEIYRTITNVYAKSFVGQSIKSYQIDAEERWFNSVATGLVMEIMTLRWNKGDSAAAYTIGLLHDIGKTAINEIFGSQYASVLERVESEQMELRHAEKLAFGFDHAEAGAALLKSWGFPDEIVEPIEMQYEPENAANYRTFASMLHLSRWIASGIGGAPGKLARAFELKGEIFETLSIQPEEAMELMIDCKEQIELKEKLLSL